MTVDGVRNSIDRYEAALEMAMRSSPARVLRILIRKNWQAVAPLFR